MNTVREMHAELIRDKLRQTAQEAANTLIAAGVTEQNARLAALDAVEKLREDLRARWLDETDERDLEEAAKLREFLRRKR